MICYRFRTVFSVLCGFATTAAIAGCAHKDTQPPVGAAAKAAVAAQTDPQNVPASQSAAIQEKIAETKSRNERSLQQHDQSVHHP